MEPFTFRRAGKTILLATSSSPLGALWGWRERTGVFMPFLDAKPPALLGELVTNGAFTLLSEQELGFPEAEERWFRAVMMTCNVAGGQEKTWLPLSFHILGHQAPFRYILTWMACHLLRDEDGH